LAGAVTEITALGLWQETDRTLRENPRTPCETWDKLSAGGRDMTPVLQSTQVIEGTWEEIAAHAAAFQGRRVQLLVFPSPEPINDVAVNGSSPTEAVPPEESLAEAFARVGTIEGPPTDISERIKEVFGQAVEEKYRRGTL